MSGARFVRFYPSDWRSGCIGLNFEQQGFYIAVCAFIYDTDQRLPANDSAAAKLLGVHTNAYKKLRDQLAEAGKIVLANGLWTVPRADKELAAAHQARSQKRPADQDTRQETSQDTLGDTPHETHQDICENDSKINDPAWASLEPIASNQEGKKRASARGRSESFWSKALGTPTYDGGVRLENGRIVLADANREFWLDEFDGDGKALDLALIRAAGYVQPASSTRLRAQVDSQLARIVADRRDQTKRYEASKAEREARAPAQSKPKRTLADALRDYDARAA